ncbi:Rv3235 family protein [Nocardia camponoti]|uniref:Uncharacterized protein n=1 Tax=Nocardia camponoti TaxID=1616106 RepID=A0A917QSS1_9NOCA|nr:Rv3235 family protein [Nocardia camponoti]GGK65342.1 hypothetical protein GCM10011591_41970 [Nocardia camponoti]
MSGEFVSLSAAPHCEPLTESGGGAHHRPARIGASGHAIRRVGSCRPAGLGRVEKARTAQRFTEQVFRLLLEVVDHRRPVQQLRGVVTERVFAAVRTMLCEDLVPGRESGSATLVRVRLTPDGPEAAEAFAVYRRGLRTLAIAGRVEWSRGNWHLVAMRMY